MLVFLPEFGGYLELILIKSYKKRLNLLNFLIKLFLNLPLDISRIILQRSRFLSRNLLLFALASRSICPDPWARFAFETRDAMAANFARTAKLNFPFLCLHFLKLLFALNFSLELDTIS